MPTFSFYLSDKKDSALVNCLRAEEKPSETIREALRAWYEGQETVLELLKQIDRKLDAMYAMSGGQGDIRQGDEVDVRQLDALLRVW